MPHRNSDALLFKLIAEANKKGLKLKESSAPRGERKWYHLSSANTGETIYESTSLKRIEAELAKY